MVYMNTNVTRGSGEFAVTAIGMATEVGHISGMLQAEEAVKTPLTRQLSKLTHQILWIAGVALVASMALNLARGDKFTTVFTAAVAFAIGALPENLPAVATTILAYGTQTLAKAGAIMKRLQSTETLGSTSAINSDKTGTLTLNQMTAVHRRVYRHPPPDHRLRAARSLPQDHAPRRPAVGDLPGRVLVHRRGHRDPQGGAAQQRGKYPESPWEG
jgi:Ca2+-transporting ATPase